MRVAIVNDLPMAVEGLSRVISASNNNQVAWTAWNGVEAPPVIDGTSQNY